MQTDSDKHQWKLIGLVILSIRFIQGWIFWGGGSRRFIYDPSKLDPYSAEWMANKLQSAMPGALLGVSNIVSFLLTHFYLLYSAIIVFSLVELIAGLGLLFGFFTRLAGFITALISILLMLLFGWQGATCMDEWTMAIANLSIGLTLAISGGYIYSVDHRLLMNPRFAANKWFSLLSSGPLSYKTVKHISIGFLIFTIVFALLTYNYFRGSIFTPYHAGPVSPGATNYQLTHGYLNANNTVSFMIYVDAGTSAAPSNIVRIEMRDEKGKVIDEWDSKTLSQLPSTAIKNIYDYNKVSVGPFGIAAPLSAKAEIVLPLHKDKSLENKAYQLEIYTVNGKRFNMPIETQQ